MSTIVLRWEWRTFGPSFEAAEAVLAAGSTEPRVEETDELYLVSAAGDNVKIRAALLDIKTLVEVDPRGLQRWQPELKAPFPLTAEHAAATFAALRLPVPDLRGRELDQDELLDAVTRAGGSVRPVEVHKRRVRHDFAGAMVEVTDFWVGDRRIGTIAVESVDPDVVWAAVDALGLRDRVNTSVPRGLLALVDDERPRHAVIDVGTNSVKFHVAERADDGTWQRVVDRAETTRLGDGLAQTGAISDTAVERTTAAVAGMVEEARHHRAQTIVAVGTAGLRSAANRDDVLAALEAGTGVVVEVISGEDESRLAFLAVSVDLLASDGTLVVFDTGGGSSQFTFGHGTAVDERFSVEVGAVRYTEAFGLDGPVSPETLGEALAAIRSDLVRLEGRTTPDALVGMGGAMTNLTAVMLGLERYDPDAVHGTTLPLGEVDRQIEQYRTRDVEARRAITGLQPARADVILAGACIVRTVMELLGQTSLTVSDRGLRHGVLHDRRS